MKRTKRKRAGHGHRIINSSSVSASSSVKNPNAAMKKNGGKYNYSNKRKMLIVGFDGASFSLLNKWATAGPLPTFKGLIEKGGYGMLKSTIPPITFPAIPSFMTGQNPGKHGVSSFFRPKKDMSLGLVHSGSLKGEFWNLGNLKNMKKLLINLPLTYPAKPIKGTLITGALTPDKEDDYFTHPKSLKDDYSSIFKNYIIDVDLTYAPGMEKQYWGECRKTAEGRTDLAEVLLKEREWDIAIIYYTLLDRLQHNLFGLDNNEWIRKGYQLADSILNRLMANIPEGSTTMVFSDHGFGRSKGRFYPNAWLAEKGLLVYKDGGKGSSLMGKLRAKQGSSGMKMLSRLIPGSVKQKLIGRMESKGGSYDMGSVDWEKTSYYATINGIYKNKKGLADPAVSLDEICTSLRNLKDPSTGKQLKVTVWKKSELYEGPRVDDMPDIVYSIGNYAFEPFASFENLPYLQSFENVYKGWHREEGIFLSSGPQIKQGELKDIQIFDLAPTFIHLLGNAVPSDLDGRVIRAILKDGGASVVVRDGPEGEGGSGTEINEDDTLSEKTLITKTVGDMFRRGDI